MQTTTNYGYNLVESTDTCNVPVQISPNFTDIDNDLKAVSDAAITIAVDTFASNTHALVRNDADRNYLYFVAPADYTAGDTFTLDGVTINATNVAGEALETNAFRVNSVVAGVVYGTRLTLMVVNPVNIPTLDADNVTYDNSNSGLTANDVQAAIDEIVSAIPTGFAATAITYNNTVSGLTATNAQTAIDELAAAIHTSESVTVVADGIKTYKQVLNSLWAAADVTKIGANSKILEGDTSYDAIYGLSQKTSANEFIFARPAVSVANTVITALSVAPATSARYNSVNGNITDNSNTVMPLGQHYILQY